jgi:predicted XRE-type DNA-binding protein
MVDLKKLIEEAGFKSVSSFAEKVGITQSNMSKIVNGKAI